jgi:MraZ protein
VVRVFSGSYIHTVDEKSRVAMPSKFREILGDEFMLTKGPDGCLWALGKSQWETVIGRASDSVVVQRFFIAPATRCQLAGKGRFLIADVLREHADIKPGDDAVIVGLGSRVEVWGKRRWEAINANVTSERLRQELPELFAF